jgi:hypothetical protein
MGRGVHEKRKEVGRGVHEKRKEEGRGVHEEWERRWEKEYKRRG